MSDLDTPCFFCLLAACDEASPRCLWRNLRLLRAGEARMRRAGLPDWVTLAYLGRLSGQRPRVLYARAERAGVELRRAGRFWCVPGVEAGRLLA